MEYVRKIGASWLGWIKLGKPSSLKLLFYITMNKTWDMYKVLLTQSWWLLPISLLIGVLMPVGFFAAWFIFIIACCARSSVDAKNYRYFLGKTPLLILYGAGIVFLWLLKIPFASSLAATGKSFSPFIVLCSQTGVLLLCMLFFILDSGMWRRPLLHAPTNSMLLFLFNYPAVFFISIFLIFYEIAWMYGLSLLLGLTRMMPLSMVFSPAFVIGLTVFMMIPCIAFVHTFYIKAVYESSDVYTYF